MDKTLKKSVESYTNLARQNRSKTTSAGRTLSDAGKDKYIWKDIKEKVALKKNQSILDLGCGMGGVLDECLADSKKLNLELTLFDIPEVIKQVKKLSTSQKLKNVKYYSGIFPLDVPKDFWKKQFDVIVVYSVLHCTEKPEEFIEALLPLLAPRGRLLIGDVANVNKKGRFLSSPFGRKFEAKYKKISVAEVPHYKTHMDYAKKQTIQNKFINDSLIIGLMTNLRQRGFNVFVLPQSSKLPYSYTREDLMIERC